MTNKTPTPLEVLAACRAHGSTAKGWRVLAASLVGRPVDASACYATADRLDATGEMWGGAMTTLTGHDAIAHAETNGLTLNKYADPIEDARDGLSVDDAIEVAAEDPNLIWIAVEK